MKKRFLIFTFILLTILLLPACDAKNSESIKAITKPYIAQYECISATYGEDNLLDKYDYIKVVFIDKSEMCVLYKIKNGEKRSFKGTYTLDPETRELKADVGILGYNIRQTTIVENGKFTVSKSIGGKQLIMNFENK